MTEQPGLVILFGSGERSPSARSIWDWLFDQLTPPIQVAILETPAGFEPNSALVAGRMADFIDHHLRNHQPQTIVVPARKRGTPFSPDDPDILKPMLNADVLFIGPGSPTYAVRQLEDSLAWEILAARHQMGTAIVLASAAAIAVGAHALPVYEIYKVGEDLHWHRGLNFFEQYGLSPVFIPHWNNTEGGADLDTSRCYMGQERFAQLLTLLPSDAMVVGIEEHTALILDVAEKTCHIRGSGGVTLLQRGEARHFGTGRTFALTELGAGQMPLPGAHIRPKVLQLIHTVQTAHPSNPEPPDEVRELVDQRQKARACRDWARADELREDIAALGWRVLDTRQGPQLEPVGDR